ncbi:N-acetylneuraminate synthase family protein [Candidatus Falkowbacteria bacterium]|nr:N-acetylneuraminate synthase family protein [Candidatus Falkowbacteria bacterium]
MNVEFIAEVSSNHSQNLGRCLEFIQIAKKIGCDGVKFQLFKIDELFASEILATSEEHRSRKKWELPVEFIPKLADECHGLGLKFACTPFYQKAVDILAPYVDYFKIASYEILWEGLLKKCAWTGKPIKLATGMANTEEVAKAVNILKKSDAKEITLYHCVSSYPAPAAECNLSVLETYRKMFNCLAGWSDHSVDEKVLSRAAFRWQASSIEFHLDLDGKGEEFARGYNWLPEQIEKVIRDIKADVNLTADYTLSDGDGVKRCKESESIDREWRADPSDGLRPLLKTRDIWKKEHGL